MATARLRLHGDLASLVHRRRRTEAIAGAIEQPIAEHASLKHLIESLGVPHTEVGVVSVGGRVAAIDGPVADHDSEVVDVFPRGPAHDPDRTVPPDFIADAHLGGLARRLRLLGFDTALAGEGPDSGIAARAAAEDRIVLTRDRGLLMHRIVRAGRFVRATRTDAQMHEVLRHFGLRAWVRPFTRCLECNAPLSDASADDVASRVPDRIATAHRAFMRCPSCGRVYWTGSHWRRLCSVVERATATA